MNDPMAVFELSGIDLETASYDSTEDNDILRKIGNYFEHEALIESIVFGILLIF